MLVRAFPFLDPAHISSDLSERLHSLGRDCGLLYRGAGVPADAIFATPAAGIVFLTGPNTAFRTTDGGGSSRP